MFNIGDVISVSKKGICRVDNIAKDVFDGCDKSKFYYVLKPINEVNNMVVYMQIDSKIAMRKIITKSQAENALVEIVAINQIDDISDNERLTVYNKIISDGDFSGWIKLLNTLGFRKKTQPKKIFSFQEQKHLTNLFDLVCNEISIATQKDETEIKSYLQEKLEI